MVQKHKILVTGATGVLGRRVVRLLATQGHDVTGVARSDAKAQLLRDCGAVPAQVDLFDGRAVRKAVEGKDAVINLATSIPPGNVAAFKKSWRMNHRVRREASANIAAAAAAESVPLVIQESITFLYADGGSTLLTEESPLLTTWVTASALDAERRCLAYAAQGGAGVVLRFSAFYGADSGHTLDTVKAARKGWALSVGARAGYLSSVTTDDAASAVLAALRAPTGIYNVTEDVALTRQGHFDALADALGVTRLRFPPRLAGHLFGPKMSMMMRSHRVSNAKFTRVTGWQPRHSDAASGWPVVIGELDGATSLTRMASDARSR